MLPRLAPMLAVTGPLPPAREDDRWAYEIKWDGVRAITYVERDGGLRMESRNLLDITPRYPEVHGLAEGLAGRDAILDGEVVALDGAGRPSFGRLQQRMHTTGAADIARNRSTNPVTYMLFDLLWLDGEPLLAHPYRERREALLGLGLAGGSWLTPAHHVGDGEAMRAASRAQALEGIVAKRLESPYEPGKRSRHWLKVKNMARQEVVIGGWLPGAGNRSGRIGALIAGVYEGGELRYAGKVGTGFSDAELRDLGRLFEPLERDVSPFSGPLPYKQARFVEPVHVAEVEFAEWTTDGLLRHPSYKGLRDDKDPREVVRESVSPPRPALPPG